MTILLLIDNANNEMFSPTYYIKLRETLIKKNTNRVLSMLKSRMVEIHKEINLTLDFKSYYWLKIRPLNWYNPL